MMTRSIVGRFLILAILVVSLGVIAQAAMIITRETGKKAVAKTDAPAATAAAPVAADAGQARTAAVVAPEPPASEPAAVPGGGSAVALATQPLALADAAPVRVVYPGPLGDVSAQPRKIADAAPASPIGAPVLPGAAGLQTAALVQGFDPPPAAAPAPQPAPAAEPAASPSPRAAATPGPQPTDASKTEVASLEPAQPGPAGAPTGGKGIDINSASAGALDRVGGGHIGQSIVQHRPYRSVEDLLRKRVIRRSVYEQIKSQIATQ